MQKEVWKDIPNYEGLYMVSNHGLVKSIKCNREKILKPFNVNGYNGISFMKDGVKKIKLIHQVVAMAFLNHEANDRSIVVDHKDNDKRNNHVDNLQILSNRDNSRKGLETYSNYKGVSFRKKDSKWTAQIKVNGKLKYLGAFKTEIEAKDRYEDFVIQHNIGHTPINIETVICQMVGRLNFRVTDNEIVINKFIPYKRLRSELKNLCVIKQYTCYPSDDRTVLNILPFSNVKR
jgi:hypothetical protein